MVGLYAGLHFSGIMAPVEKKMSVTMYTDYWQIVDSYMGQRMPTFGQLFLGLYVVNLLLFIRQWKKIVFWIILIGLILLLADMILTLKQQLPINQYIQSVNSKNLTNEQLTKLEGMKKQAEENFGFRHSLSIISFILLSVTPFLLSRQSKTEQIEKN
jgi:uncharacterized membrane protein